MEKRIIKIEATQGFRTSNAEQRPLTRRAVGYARVSTEKDEQQSSLEAQMTYFPTFIAEHPGWAYVGMYFDDGASGANFNRPGWQEIIAKI
jgi:DNA invertase Pin-like site-specific DNA recombinase